MNAERQKTIFIAVLCIIPAVILCALAIVVLAGNGKYVKVSGRVTFADGTPLRRGQIVFTDYYVMGRSDLDENGEYTLHTFRKDDGVPRGTYRVYITSAIRFETMDDEDVGALQIGKLAKSHFLIDEQYMNPETSGWIVEVKKKSKFDFVVYEPGKVPEELRTEEAKFQFDPIYRQQKVREYWESKSEEEQEENNRFHQKRRTVNPNLL